MANKTWNVKLEFDSVSAENPLEAVKKILNWIEDGANKMIYEVADEDTNEKFIVDLDEETVLPNND